MNVIIIGGGQAGSHIGHLLQDNEINIKIIEVRDILYQKLSRDFPSEVVVLGSGTDPYSLESAGIEEADVLVAVTGSDEVNLVAATIAKFEFAVPRVVARVNNPNNTWLYNTEMGVDVAINQSELLAQIVVGEMDLQHIPTLMKLNRGNLSIVKLYVNSESRAISKSIKELIIPSKCVLIAILRDEDQVIIPRGDTIIEANDYILLLADESAKK
ncbi:potassium channel family protein [Bacillus marasmi]|uniref:potassium channel family protein n=1 Tax=Bacillus marasmi TaxID=1926279 RepID=UPI00164D470E|nr:TrkA family potassium uptake protein [Bacillus marasmi]